MAAAQWWLYFDVVALVSARRLARATPGREQNALARDSYSYIHFLMVAGIVLAALGLKKTLGDVDDPLETVPAFALLGGVAIYLLGLVAFRFRHVQSINRQRLVLALVAARSDPACDRAARRWRASPWSPRCSGRWSSMRPAATASAGHETRHGDLTPGPEGDLSSAAS